MAPRGASRRRDALPILASTAIAICACSASSRAPAPATPETDHAWAYEDVRDGYLHGYAIDGLRAVRSSSVSFDGHAMSGPAWFACHSHPAQALATCVLVVHQVVEVLFEGPVPTGLESLHLTVDGKASFTLLGRVFEAPPDRLGRRRVSHWLPVARSTIEAIAAANTVSYEGYDPQDVSELKIAARSLLPRLPARIADTRRPPEEVFRTSLCGAAGYPCASKHDPHRERWDVAGQTKTWRAHARRLTSELPACERSAAATSTATTGPLEVLVLYCGLDDACDDSPPCCNYCSAVWLVRGSMLRSDQLANIEVPDCVLRTFERPESTTILPEVRVTQRRIEDGVVDRVCIP